MNDPVGPVLRMGGQIDDVVAAIREDNPEQEIETIDRGSYVRVQTPGRMRLTLETLRAYLGPDYDLALFGSMMPSFSGRIVTTSDELVWESIKTPRSDRHEQPQSDPQSEGELV